MKSDLPPAGPLIFLHIPKTAGTTFHAVLSWQHLGRPSYWIPPEDLHAETFRALGKERREQLRLLRGHMYYGLDAYLAEGARYITFVRDPVRRLESYYRYGQSEARSHPDSGHWWHEAMRNWSIREFLDRGADSEFDNGQVRRISGLGFEKRPCTEDDLRRARSNIDDRFAFAGVTERFDESLILMAEALNWRRPLAYRREKVRGNRDRRPIDGDDLRRLRDANLFDLALYRYVEERLGRAADLVPRMDLRLERLRRNNRLLGALPIDGLRTIKRTLVR